MTASSIIKCFEELFATFGAPSYIHSDQGPSFMSKELKFYLTSVGVATSRTTPYNAPGNGQVERYNGIVWNTIELALQSRNLEITHWEEVLNDALHSIRSLLCTATNETPHGRFFKHPRRSGRGSSIPTWLMTPGPVLIKRQIRNNKYEPKVDLVTLLECNPEYALIRFPDGREARVSTRCLAPAGGCPNYHQEDVEEEETKTACGDNPPHPMPRQYQDPLHGETPTSHKENNEVVEPTTSEPPNVDETRALEGSVQPERLSLDEVPCQVNSPVGIRRSGRTRRLPTHLEDYELY